jgi:tRNA dimethylallyltransferase
MKPKIIFIVGPTAIGKTEIAVNLAKKLKAEIVSCDSMQIYKYMDIITSKPSKKILKEIPHYLIGRLNPCREYNVSSYRRQALGKIKEILEKGKTPIFVGGTGLYMSILIDGIFSEKAKDDKVRVMLYRQAKKFGGKYLHDKLKNIDYEAALKIHPNDTKRIVRALEVFKTSGKPISVLQKTRKGLKDKYDIKVICLNLPREKLYRKINQRVEEMFDKGLVSEAKKLLKLKLSKTAACAIGIKEIKCYLDGSYNLKQVKDVIKRNTRRYAKRQLCWFRKDKRIEWLKIKTEDSPEMTANRILSMIKRNEK